MAETAAHVAMTAKAAIVTKKNETRNEETRCVFLLSANAFLRF